MFRNYKVSKKLAKRHNMAQLKEKSNWNWNRIARTKHEDNIDLRVCFLSFPSCALTHHFMFAGMGGTEAILVTLITVDDNVIHHRFTWINPNIVKLRWLKRCSNVTKSRRFHAQHWSYVKYLVGQVIKLIMIYDFPFAVNFNRTIAFHSLFLSSPMIQIHTLHLR